MVAKRFVVTGTVQGVFFRTYTKAKANELGITGWVRNCDDGTVEVHAEGEEAALEQLEEWLQRGPTVARVVAVETQDAMPQGMDSFNIKYE